MKLFAIDPNTAGRPEEIGTDPLAGTARRTLLSGLGELERLARILARAGVSGGETMDDRSATGAKRTFLALLNLDAPACIWGFSDGWQETLARCIDRDRRLLTTTILEEGDARPSPSDDIRAGREINSRPLTPVDPCDSPPWNDCPGGFDRSSQEDEGTILAHAAMLVERQVVRASAGRLRITNVDVQRNRDGDPVPRAAVHLAEPGDRLGGLIVVVVAFGLRAAIALRDRQAGSDLGLGPRPAVSSGRRRVAMARSIVEPKGEAAGDWLGSVAGILRTAAGRLESTPLVGIIALLAGGGPRDGLLASLAGNRHALKTMNAEDRIELRERLSDSVAIESWGSLSSHLINVVEALSPTPPVDDLYERLARRCSSPPRHDGGPPSARYGLGLLMEASGRWPLESGPSEVDRLVVRTVMKCLDGRPLGHDVAGSLFRILSREAGRDRDGRDSPVGLGAVALKAIAEVAVGRIREGRVAEAFDGLEGLVSAIGAARDEVHPLLECLAARLSPVMPAPTARCPTLRPGEALEVLRRFDRLTASVGSPAWPTRRFTELVEPPGDDRVGNADALPTSFWSLMAAWLDGDLVAASAQRAYLIDVAAPVLERPEADVMARLGGWLAGLGTDLPTYRAIVRRLLNPIEEIDDRSCLRRTIGTIAWLCPRPDGSPDAEKVGIFVDSVAVLEDSSTGRSVWEAMLIDAFTRPEVPWRGELGRWILSGLLAGNVQALAAGHRLLGHFEEGDLGAEVWDSSLDLFELRLGRGHCPRDAGGILDCLARWRKARGWSADSFDAAMARLGDDIDTNIMLECTEMLRFEPRADGSATRAVAEVSHSTPPPASVEASSPPPVVVVPERGRLLLAACCLLSAVAVGLSGLLLARMQSMTSVLGDRLNMMSDQIARRSDGLGPEQDPDAGVSLMPPKGDEVPRLEASLQRQRLGFGPGPQVLSLRRGDRATEIVLAELGGPGVLHRPKGLEDSVPIHRILLGRTEVTREQFSVVVGRPPPDPDADRDRFPVDLVSWDDAQEFCRRVEEAMGAEGYAVRLPSRSEWEYAASMALPADGAPIEAAPGTLQLAGESAESPQGVCDLLGNVREWCQDPPGPPLMLVGPDAGPAEDLRIIMGVDARFSTDSDPLRLDWKPRSGSESFLGFRIVIAPRLVGEPGAGGRD